MYYRSDVSQQAVISASTSDIVSLVEVSCLCFLL